MSIVDTVIVTLPDGSGANAAGNVTIVESSRTATDSTRLG